MIKFSQKTVKKSEILDLIDNELLCIEVRLTFQRKLNEQVLSYLKAFMNNNYDANDHEKINTMSDYLNNASRILKRSSANLSKFESLQEKLTSMHECFSELEKPSSNVIKTQFEDYNKKYTEILEKTEPATSEIQAFLAQCEQDDILQKLLLEKELAKKANEFVNKISTIEIQSISNSESQQSKEINITSEAISKEIEIDSNKIIEANTKIEETQIETTKSIVVAEEPSNENINFVTATEKISSEAIDSVSIVEKAQIKTAESTDISEETSNETIESITIPTETSSKNTEPSTLESSNETTESADKTEEQSLFEVNNFNNQAISKIVIKNISKQKSEEKDAEPIDKKIEIVENTLIISEKNGNVILPYTIEELNSALTKNPSKYKNLEDVVEKKYTRPIKYYKNSSMARFKETFKLVRERNKGPLKHAWDLALESFFNHDLHPAIISACKSIDELDIYLSCLEYDELEDFKFFKIIFDVLPTLNRKKKVST